MAELLIAFLLLQEPAHFSLAWDPNQEADLAGYRVHRGNSSGSYDTVVDIGLAAGPAYYPGLLPPGTYYFVVTAYNSGRIESPYSNEVVATVPVVPAPVAGLCIR